MSLQQHTPAAVIVLKDKKLNSLILTKRSRDMREHPGEMCFPGGLWEHQDESLYATGLRELHEELGITKDRVSLIKPLQAQYTLMGRIIYPWYASIESIHPYFLNDDEVERLVFIPMPLAYSITNYRAINIERNGFIFSSLEFIYEKEWIWGVTAKIMKQLALEQHSS